MSGRTFTFREILEAAAKPYRQLWDGNGVLSLPRVAEYYVEKGFPLSQPSIWRLYHGKQIAKDKAIEATHRVFGVPRSILRGEAVSAEMEEELARFQLSTIFLARRIEALDKGEYYQVVELIKLLETRREQLSVALAAAENVSSLKSRKAP